MTYDGSRQPTRRQSNNQARSSRQQTSTNRERQARRDNGSYRESAYRRDDAQYASGDNYADRQQGYADRQQGYDNRQQGYASRQQGYAGQRQGYADRQQGYTDQRQGYAAQGQYADYADRSQYGYAPRRDGAPARQDVSRYNDPSRYSAAGGFNSLYDPRSAAQTKKSKAPLITGIVVGIVLIALLLWFFVIPKPFEVTANGKKVTVKPGATVATLVEEGYARPTPGNLIAVDGSLLSAGEGEPFSATINDSPVATDAKLAKDMVVEIGNGGDITVDFTSAETVVPFDTVNDDMGFESYWTGSIHELKDGQDGLSTTKTGSISGKTVSEVTQPAVNGGYHIYTVQPEEKVIALTFDDGPWAGTTDEILDILETNGAKATFFTIGSQIDEQAASVKRAADMGCEICTHSWDHADGSGNGVDLTLMSASEQIEEITQGYAAIARVIGKEPAHIFRAPGGNFHDDIITTLWPYVDAEIGWDVDTEDWSKPGVDAIASRILSVEPGEVILMHDGGGDRDQTVAALRQALPTLIERGYKCVTVSELMSYNKANAQSAAQPAAESETREAEGEE